MFFVYILKSLKDGNLYIGSTNDLNRRLEEHNSGKVISTKPRLPFKAIYSEAESDARERERNLKMRKRAFAQLRKRLEGSLK